MRTNPSRTSWTRGPGCASGWDPWTAWASVNVGAILITLVLTAAAVVFFAYTGFEAVANLGEAA